MGVIRGFLSNVEKVSEDPSLKEEMEKEVGSNNPVATAAAGWANWAVGAVTSKFYKSSIQPTTNSSNEGDQSTQKSSSLVENNSAYSATVSQPSHISSLS